MRILIANHDAPSAQVMADFLSQHSGAETRTAEQVDELHGADVYLVVANNVHTRDDEPRARVQRVISHCATLAGRVLVTGGFPDDLEQLAREAGLTWIGNPLEVGLLLEAVRPTRRT